jgi:hypothetical protein
MKLAEFIPTVSGFSKWSHADKIRLFAWFLHSKRGRDRFKAADITACYAELHMTPPSSVSPFLTQMEKGKSKEVLRNAKGYALESSVREKYETKYGQRVMAVTVDKLLLDLPSQVPNLAERTFLDETIKCYRAGAFRATIVMAWNLAYHHLCDYVLRKHLAAFNAQWPKSFAKRHAGARVSAVVKHDDFAELKESEVIQICRTAAIISGDLFKVLNEKLDKRNSAAHPSNIVIHMQTAEEFILDLITNGVVKLN